MTRVASRCKAVACNGPEAALHPLHTPLGVQRCMQRNGKPARIPLGSFYARTDRKGRKYLSGRLGLMKLMLFETQEVSQGDVRWEAVLVEGPYVTPEQRTLAEEIEEVAP